MRNISNSSKIKSDKSFILTICIIFIITVFCIFFTSLPVLAQFKSGSDVPDFELEALDGNIYQLNQFYNKQNHLLLCFVKGGDSTSFEKLKDMVTFFEDYQPRESYQIIAIVEMEQDNQNIKEDYLSLQNKTEIPFLVLLSENKQTMDNFQIRNYPTILLLRPDLKVRREFSGFSSRQENNFYQYLSFTFTSQKSSGASGCDGGVCPPPEGY
jgi:hypothetical protein